MQKENRTSPDAVLLLGPTASGKTAAALRIAQKLPVEIISIDSALVYRKMDIGTAKPTAEERALVPHHLIDILEPAESYSAANFVSDCTRLVREVRARGRLPLIVGGTMLYAKAVREGLSEIPSSSAEVRAKSTELLKSEGLAALYQRLMEVDPQTAARLKPQDTQRITRAWEVYEMSAKPLSEWIKSQKPPELNLLTFGLMPPDRSALHEAIAGRFEAMIKAGFLDEVRALMQIPGLSAESPSMRSVGYRQAWAHLEGKTSFAEFKEAGIAATRQLAKRQLTWMRAMDDCRMLEPASEASFEELLESCRKVLEKIS